MLSPPSKRNQALSPSTLFLLAFCVLLFFCLVLPCRALDPNKAISQYAHTDWKYQNGFLNGQVYSITQTADGYLWVGTSTGLMRFDGVRFISFAPPNSGQLSSSAVRPLLGTRDGSLWISWYSGSVPSTFSRWMNREFIDLDLPGSKHIGGIIQDGQGNVWVEQFRYGDEQGSLCEVVGDKLRCYGKEDGLPDAPAFYSAFAVDKDGYLWVGGDTGVLRWRPGTSAVVCRPNGLQSDAAIGGVTALAADADGSMWVGMVAGRGLGLEHLVHGTWKPVITAGFDSSTLEVSSLLVDTHGTLWVGTYTKGLYRISGHNVEHFGMSDGLSSNRVFALYEDRESNLWVGTAEGLDLFRDTAVATFSTLQGLCTEEVDSVMASHDGIVWIGGGDGLCALRQGRNFAIPGESKFSGHQIAGLLEDHTHRVWIGVDNKLYIHENGGFVEIKPPDSGPFGLVAGMAEDSDHNVWAITHAAAGKPLTVFRIRDGKVQEQFRAPELPVAWSVAADPHGGIWLGLTTGDLAHYVNGHLEIFRFKSAPDHLVTQVAVSSDGSTFGATAFGLIAWKNGKQQILDTRNGLPCNRVNGMIFDDANNLWLYLDCALVEVAPQQLQRWWQDSNAVLQPTVFDRFDGVRPGSAPFNNASKTPDGKLWFANRYVLQMVDPAHLGVDTTPPPVLIEAVIANGKTFPPYGAVRLPALAQDLEIDYTAVSFAAPPEVLFRYRLDGHDANWQEPGTRRQAFYTDLGPGHYRFHVIARNREGAWSGEGADLDFTIVPKWFQTVWFRLLCVGAGILFVWVAYSLRVRQVARAVGARFDERLAERTRMARELHDTFLQTVQGSKLVADDALENVGDPIRTRRALEQLSEWLGRATQEGRAALHSLRSSTVEQNDLAAAFQRALEDCRKETSMEAFFSVTGGAREMHPVVRDEVYRIGYEAIRNACIHSAGSRVEVKLNYADDLSVLVRDNGIGIDAAIAETGRKEHFGLQGMRERAARIGARLTIVSTTNAGTEVKVVVPGRVVFRTPRGSTFSKIKTALTREDNN